MLTSADRYQSGLGQPGTMPTEAWFAALMAGVDGPLGDVLDVGCAEGVMCVLAAQAGARSVLGIGLHDDRMTAAREVTKPYRNIRIREQEAEDYTEPADTVVFSMMAHWLGEDETRRFASLARRHFLVVFREANEFYCIPDNGTWFPSLAQMDETVPGIRTHEEVVLEQDRGKRIWAATYRTDMETAYGWVWKRRPGFDPTGLYALQDAGAPINAAYDQQGGYAQPLAEGMDLHGDPPFRPTHGRPVLDLSQQDRVKVLALTRGIAAAALRSGWYPTDYSPRNIIVGPDRAVLVDLDEIARHHGTVAPEHLPTWQATLRACGLEFSGRFADLA